MSRPQNLSTCYQHLDMLFFSKTIPRAHYAYEKLKLPDTKFNFQNSFIVRIKLNYKNDHLH